MRDSVFDHGFCDFAFGSAQNDRVGGMLRRVKIFRSEYPTERKSDAMRIDCVDAVCIGFGLILCQLFSE